MKLTLQILPQQAHDLRTLADLWRVSELEILRTALDELLEKWRDDLELACRASAAVR